MYDFIFRNNYDVFRDWELLEKRKLLQEYKDKIFQHHYGINLADKRPKFKYSMAMKEESGLEIGPDVQEQYPVSLEEERAQINKTVSHIGFLRDVRDTFEYCRTRCKLMDSRIRVFDAYDKQHQMCLTDCMNVRTELFGPVAPQQESKKTFVWIG